jgi:transcription initiation factor TFIIIB Brf1 subunit/transcription initiation factor TFIIB
MIAHFFFQIGIELISVEEKRESSPELAQPSHRLTMGQTGGNVKSEAKGSSPQRRRDAEKNKNQSQNRRARRWQRARRSDWRDVDVGAGAKDQAFSYRCLSVFIGG